MEWQDRIEIRPEVMLGKPVVKGTRITVELILEKMSGGYSETDLLESYPHLNQEDIRAALRFASEASSLRGFLVGA